MASNNSIIVQIRRGTTAQTSSFTGALAELTVDTDQKTLVIHDGSTSGGNYLSTKAFTQQVYDFANTISGGSASDNVARALAQSAYNTANGANGLAAGAYAQANTNAGDISVINGINATQNTRLQSIETINSDQNTAISIIQGVNNTQNTNITAVNGLAQGAYNTANTKFNSAGGTISGDVAVTGNLTVTGETFYANVTNLNVDDSFITLNANTVGSPVFDAGIEVDRGTGNNVVLYWNESTKKWRFENDLLEDDAIASEGFVSLAVSPINQFAQSAYNQANSANSLATTAYTTALGANGLAAGAYNLANTSIQNSGTQTLNGNLIVNGSVNTTEWSNTANAYVSNKLYAGIAPQLSTPLPDLIAQFTGNTNSYVQINAENIDPEGSADFVITADVGNDASFYIDMGLHNSNRQFGATYPLDGYLIVQGNTGQVGGNLIIGTTSQTPGQHTKIIAGGGEESNVVIQFNDDLSTLFYGNATPFTNNTQYLGSSTNRWHSVFVGPGSVDIDNIVLSNNNGKLVISGASDIVISGSSVPPTGDISNKANNAYDKANAAFDSSNSVNQFAQSAYTTANGANGLAAGAFNTANGANGLAASAYAQANTGTGIAQAAFAFANTLFGGSATDNVARTLAQSAYDSSNLVNQFAASAYSTANGANGLAAGAYNQANTNATNITAVNQFAQSAYNTANSKFNSTGGTITGDVNVAGNLSVTGTTFYANTEQLHVKDNIITLNSNVTGTPTLDAGIEVNRGIETNTVLKWSESNHAWQFTNDGTNFFRIADTDRVNSAFSLANTNAGSIAIIQGVNLGQNTTITEVNQFAVSAYNQANTNATNISITNGVDATQNTRLNSIETINSDQNTAISIIQGVNLGQNTTITAVNQYAQSAYDTANSTNGFAVSAFGKANSANVLAQSAYDSSNAVNGYAVSAFATANGANGLAAGAYAQANTNAGAIAIIQGVDLGQNTTITAVNNFAQSAYDTANGANGLANGAYAAANTAYSYGTQIQAIADAAYLKANAAFDSSNSVNGYAVSAFATANGANGLAAGAYAQANTNAGAIAIIQGINATQNTKIDGLEGVDLAQNSAISIIQGVDSTQNTNITAVNTFAQSAYDKANSANVLAQSAYDTANLKFSTSGGNINGSVVITANNDLTITGNLFVLGNTTSFGTQTLEVVDPMILLATGNYTTDLLDIGFAGSYNDGANAHTGLFRDAPGNKDWYFFEGYTPEVSGNNNINVADASFRTSNVNVNYLKGNLIATTITIDGRDQASVDATQNTRLNSVETININQNTSISIIQGVDNTQNTNITIADTKAQAAFDSANTKLSLSGGIVAGNVTANSVIANNSIYAPTVYSTGATSRLDLSDIGLVGITVAGQTYQFGGSGIEANQGVFGGSFGGNRLSLNNETNLISNRYDTVKIQTGTTGAVANEFVFANNAVTLPGALIQTNASRITNTFTTSSTSQVAVDSFSASTYRSAKYEVQVTSGVEYHVIELRVVHDGTTTYLAQYGEIFTSSSLGTFDTDISGGNLRLLFTGANSVSVVKLVRDAINS